MGDHPKGMDFTSLPSLHMTMAQKVLDRLNIMIYVYSLILVA